MKCFFFCLDYPFSASRNGKEWKCSKFLRIIQTCVLQTRTESLKPCIELGVWWSAKLFLQTVTQKSLLCVPMVVTYYIKSFRKGTDRHDGILMSLLLVVAETMINLISNEGKWSIKLQKLGKKNLKKFKVIAPFGVTWSSLT